MNWGNVWDFPQSPMKLSVGAFNDNITKFKNILHPLTMKMDTYKAFFLLIFVVRRPIRRQFTITRDPLNIIKFVVAEETCLLTSSIFVN